MVTVAVLFARGDSVYKTIPGCDVFDEARDARTWSGASPVIAHPPCRAWGRLRTFAKPAPHEKALAILAVHFIRQFGGVLEHPHASTLWPECSLPLPGHGRDAHGGWTLPVDQFWFGHAARKRTLLYIVGCEPQNVPLFPITLGRAPGLVTHISKADREHTPPVFARWLFELAKLCEVRS